MARIENTPKNRKGFTIIELLVVLAVVGILATIGVVNASQGRQRARDNERKIALEQIRVALELYKDQHGGQYPCTGTCTSPNWYVSAVGGSYSTNSGNWIPNFTPTYIGALPRDPLGGNAPSGTGSCSGFPRRYAYYSNGSDYSLLSLCGVERGPVLSNDPYYNFSNTWSFKVCTPRACTIFGDPSP